MLTWGSTYMFLKQTFSYLSWWLLPTSEVGLANLLDSGCLSCLGFLEAVLTHMPAGAVYLGDDPRECQQGSAQVER